MHVSELFFLVALGHGDCGVMCVVWDGDMDVLGGEGMGASVGGEGGTVEVGG